MSSLSSLLAEYSSDDDGENDSNSRPVCAKAQDMTCVPSSSSPSNKLTKTPSQSLPHCRSAPNSNSNSNTQRILSNTLTTKSSLPSPPSPVSSALEEAGWFSTLDPTSKQIYYYNAQGITRWDNPLSAPPPNTDYASDRRLSISVSEPPPSPSPPAPPRLVAPRELYPPTKGMEGGQCHVCLLYTHKYRCPGCSVLFCSMSCSKLHKQKRDLPVNLFLPSLPLTQEEEFVIKDVLDGLVEVVEFNETGEFSTSPSSFTSQQQQQQQQQQQCSQSRFYQGCTGKRSKTSFLKLSDMNDSTLTSDYYFLEEVLRVTNSNSRRTEVITREASQNGSSDGSAVGGPAQRGREGNKRHTDFVNQGGAVERLLGEEGAKKRRTSRGESVSLAEPTAAVNLKLDVSASKPSTNTTSAIDPYLSSLLPPLRSLVLAAQLRGTNLMIMPTGMSRRTSNESTRYKKKGDTIFWKIEVLFFNSDGRGGGGDSDFTVNEEGISENQKFSILLEKYFEVSVENSGRRGKLYRFIDKNAKPRKEAAPKKAKKTNISKCEDGAQVDPLVIEASAKEVKEKEEKDWDEAERNLRYVLLMKKIGIKSPATKKDLFVKIDSTVNIKKMLEGLSVIEYPTIYVVKKGVDEQAFEMIVQELDDESDDGLGA